MKIGVSVKIDVTKIDKERLFVGQKGTYLDATTFIDLDNVNEYGDNGFISQSVSKEEREQGANGEILGNVKVFFNDSKTRSAPPQHHRQPAPPPGAPAGYEAQGVKQPDFDDDIPF